MNWFIWRVCRFGLDAGIPTLYRASEIIPLLDGLGKALISLISVAWANLKMNQYRTEMKRFQNLSHKTMASITPLTSLGGMVTLFHQYSAVSKAVSHERANAGR